jgi:hypothetical protein
MITRTVLCCVRSGTCSSQLARMKPGPLNHSRWLTIASRVLREYVSTNKPSVSLTTLATYILKVFAPVWFIIKTNWYYTDGSKNLFKLISYSRYLPEKLKRIIDPVIQQNAYFAHPENILLAMLTDDRLQVSRREARKNHKYWHKEP